MAARSVLFTTANRTILDHLLPFSPKHANNGSNIDTAFGAKLRRRIEAIIAIAVALFHFAVEVLKSS